MLDASEEQLPRAAAVVTGGQDVVRRHPCPPTPADALVQLLGRGRAGDSRHLAQHVVAQRGPFCRGADFEGAVDVVGDVADLDESHAKRMNPSQLHVKRCSPRAPRARGARSSRRCAAAARRTNADARWSGASAASRRASRPSRAPLHIATSRSGAARTRATGASSSSHSSRRSVTARIVRGLAHVLAGSPGGPAPPPRALRATRARARAATRPRARPPPPRRAGGGAGASGAPVGPRPAAARRPR